MNEIVKDMVPFGADAPTQDAADTLPSGKWRKRGPPEWAGSRSVHFDRH